MWDSRKVKMEEVENIGTSESMGAIEDSLVDAKTDPTLSSGVSASHYIQETGMAAVDMVAPVIIVAPGHEFKSECNENDLLHAGGVEPPQKRYKVEQEDGQTYYLTITDESGLAVNSVPVVSAEQTTTVKSAASSKNVEAQLDITQAWFTTRDEKNTLHQKGYNWKQGQWSSEEIQVLEANIRQYCIDHEVTDATDIIFTMSKDERKDFYRTVAKGLQRPLFSVYRRVTRMYDQKNHIGKYTDEEISKLKELKQKHGTDWASIGAALGRSASSVKDRWRLMKDTCNSGKWLSKEETLLADAVYEQSGCKPGESVTSGLSWAQVAEKVGTRSEKQCRTKWLNYLNWKQKGGTDWTRQDNTDLLCKIALCGAQTENDINWEELTRGWPSARSPQWLRGKWWSLKRNDPEYKLKPLQQVVLYVQDLMNRTLKSKGSVTVMKAQLLAEQCAAVSKDSVLKLTLPAAHSDAETVNMKESAEKSEEETAVQEYEVIHPTTSGSYIITQPQNNPAVSVTGSIASDHIYVHALPVAQVTPSGDVQENVMVQVNPQVIIRTSGEIIPDSLQLSHTIVQSQQEEHKEGQPTNDDVEEEEIPGVLDDNQVISNESLIVSANSYEAQTEGTEEHSELAIRSESSQFVRTPSNETELMPMASLSDPMLANETADNSELIEATSDGETDKNQEDS